jgi:hypothetical protein
MKKQWALLGALALCAIALAGCVPTGPDCDVGDLVQPIPSGPLGNMIITAVHTELLWSYGAGHECQPDGFELELATDSGFTSIFAYGDTPAFDTSWTFPPLTPATQFWWRVAGGIDDGMGGLDLGPWSIASSFYTGPICAPGDGVANLIWPTDGEIVTTVLPLLDWEWSLTDCVPEGYRIDLYEDVEPVSDILSGGTGNPNTAWFPGDDLLDCHAYRWFVTPMVDDMLGTSSVEWGFYIDVGGLCTGVGGMVWHDECGLPTHGPFPITPPPGCIDDGLGGYIGNGVIDPGETGIGGVTLHIGAGPCPSTGLATAVTDGFGHYDFFGLADGTYCISVDSLADGNDLVIIPGGWSFPAATTSLVSQEVVVSGGTAADVNFGWDWQFLPVPRTSGIAGGDPLPTGCIDVGGGVLEADGIWDAHELGIQGVTLDLGFGPCPSTGAYTTVTDIDGNYLLPGLFDGTYCVTVDSLAHGNDLVLIPGSWTFPDRGVNPQEVEFNIVVPPEGVDVGLPLQDFGWDYQFLPMPEGESMGETKEGANCRTGPGFFPVQWFLPEGTRMWIEGREYDSEWLKGLPEDLSVACWILAEKVDTLVPVEELTILWEPELLDGSISGWLYKDNNGNSIPDAGDDFDMKVTMTLSPGLCTPTPPSGLTATTDGDGYFIFPSVTPGDYCLSHNSRYTYVPNIRNVTVLSGQSLTNVNFRR